MLGSSWVAAQLAASAPWVSEFMYVCMYVCTAGGYCWINSLQNMKNFYSIRHFCHFIIFYNILRKRNICSLIYTIGYGHLTSFFISFNFGEWKSYIYDLLSCFQFKFYVWPCSESSNSVLRLSSEELLKFLVEFHYFRSNSDPQMFAALNNVK
jgi:hypothetical protein